MSRILFCKLINNNNLFYFDIFAEKFILKIRELYIAFKKIM